MKSGGEGGDWWYWWFFTRQLGNFMFGISVYPIKIPIRMVDLSVGNT